MKTQPKANNLKRIKDLENRLAEAEQLINAIREGEVDAFALRSESKTEVFTLQSGDYAYRVLVEKFNEGAINVTEEGLIVYSNKYFHELLGLSYKKVIGTLLHDFIHPQSIATFNSLFTNALDQQSKGEINLIAATKIIPVYVSLTTLYPRLPTIGIIVTDLTEKKKQEKILEDKNKELERSNLELESFSYSASHDLQEPLRKIQVFAGRILLQEKHNFSEKSIDYFTRITSSAARMQNLIEALLSYSITDTNEKIFIPTNLTNVIEETKEDLQELIEQNNAVIESSALPIVNIIPLQFQQLITNIISNSIKYRKKNVNPVIKINAVKVSVSELKAKVDSKADKFWKISITDNGIGFEPQYATKIFDLFQRLHGKDEYSGTGIGLATCKKIMRNHSGIIIAESEPDKGATFHIYLPFSN
ncbi:MAG: ATP-binding protein [Flavobacteriales bacterium]|nr:ATP-binding protein [Flavobacteriales bacterium]